jgi:RNA polymerase sigma factor (sigma-70 family)
MAPSELPGPPELDRLLDASTEAAREQAWEDLIRRHGRLLLHVARSTARDYDVKMDRYAHILEMLRADDFRRLRAYRSDRRSRFTTWLVIVAQRICIDLERSRYGRVRSDSRQAADVRRTRRDIVELIGSDVEVSSIIGVDDPEADYATAQIRAAVLQTLETLPPRDRLLIKLRYEDELSVEQIASLLGLKNRFHVHRQLKAILAQLRGDLLRRGIRTAAAD